MVLQVIHAMRQVAQAYTIELVIAEVVIADPEGWFARVLACLILA